MITQEVLDKVRQALVDSLEESIKIYTKQGTKEWINEENCRELIEKIKSKRPTIIGGPFWGEHISEALYKCGFPDDGPNRSEHYEIWKRIEQGE